METAGVVLFVDISGFSALTERLTQEKGGAGVDQMARILDEKFTRIIARIEDAGGEVATTAGDAVFAWWEARSEGARAQATRRAVACTQAIAAELVAPIEGITVRVRQSIAAGPLLAVRLGEDPPAALLDGPTIDELAELDPRPGGPAVLTRGAARALEDLPEERADVEPIGSAVQTATYVDPRRARWLADPDRRAELRVVTTLFARIEVAGADLAQRHAAVSAAQRVIASNRGVVLSVCRDDKGLVVVAAFGLPAPEVFHPADPARAAVALLAAVGLPVGVGLATGRTWFGATRAGTHARRRDLASGDPAPPGGGTRRVDLIGSPMNLAARLMMLGPGAWCDRPTARGAGLVVRTEPAGNHRFKGFSEGIDVVRLVRLEAEPEDTFVGRDKALGAVERALEGVHRGVGGLVVVTGEPGVGKTALLQQARRRARGQGLDVHTLGGAEPFGPWWDADDTVGVADAVRGLVRAARATERLVERWAPGATPRVLVLDDAAMDDDRTSEVLHRLVERGVLCFVATRASALQQHSAATEIALGPLDRAELQRLIAVRLSPRDARPLAELDAPGLVEWLEARAGGHPHFSIELLSVAQELGFLQVDPSGNIVYFDRAGLVAASPPDTIQAALVARLDRLPTSAVLALKAASCVGVDVDRRALERLVPTGLDDALAPLLRAGWLVPAEFGGGYRFANVATHAVVHALLVREQRREMHGVLARWLGDERTALAMTGRPPPVDPAVIANHFAHAGLFAEAQRALELAWHAAMADGQPRVAAEQTRRALALDAEAGELGAPMLSDEGRAAWNLRGAEACRGYGDTALAVTHLEDAARRLALPRPKTLAAWRARLAWELIRHAVEWVFGGRPRSGDDLRARTLNLLSVAAYLRSDPPEHMLANAVQSVRFGWRYRGEDAPATGLATSMMAIATSGLPRLADAYLAAAARRAPASGDPREHVDAALGRLLIDVAHTRWDDVERLLAETLPIVRATRHDTLQAVFLGLFACADLFTGRFERCEERCEEMVALSERESYLQARGWASNLRASLALIRGDEATLRRYADEAQAILGHRREPDHLAPYALRAQLALTKGDLRAANEEIAALEPRLAGEIVSVTGLDVWSTPAEVHLMSAIHGDATALPRADKAIRRFRAYVRQFPVGEPRMAWLVALRIRATGGDATAATEAAKALADARGLVRERNRMV